MREPFAKDMRVAGVLFLLSFISYGLGTSFLEMGALLYFLFLHEEPIGLASASTVVSGITMVSLYFLSFPLYRKRRRKANERST